MDKELKGVLFALAGFFFIALITIVQKNIVSDLNIGLILILAGLAMSIFFSILNKNLFFETAAFIRLGLVGFGIPMALILYGFITTPGTVGGLISQAQSIATIFFAVVLLNEVITKKDKTGIILLLMGGYFVVKQKFSASESFFGESLILIGSILVGYGYIQAKILLKKYNPSQVNIIKGLGTLLVGVIVYLFTLSTTNTFNATTITSLAIYVFAGFILGHYCIVKALEYAPAWKVGVVSQTFPIFVVILGFLILGDVLSGNQWIGAGLILLGGIIISYDPKHIFSK